LTQGPGKPDNEANDPDWRRDNTSASPAQSPATPAFGNRLLNALEPDDARELAAHLETVPLRRRQQLQLPNHRIDTVYFLERGLASVHAGSRGRQLEVAMIGAEGMTGVAVLLHAERSPQRISMQIAGSAQRIPADRLRRLLSEKGDVRRVFLRYTHNVINEMAGAAFANAKATIPQRVARWILMAQDRLDTDEIQITHEALAIALGTRRPGVTAAVHDLVAQRRIAARRATIVVLDRAALVAMSAPFYVGSPTV
jgi:CRP-like cAMP-binding protein